jgi:hypothetical protein
VYSALHTHQNISSGERWWNITVLQVQFYRVLNSLHAWNFSETCWKIKKKNFYYKKTWSVPAHLNIENSLEHWNIYTYVVDSETMATEAAVSTVYHKEYFKLPTFFIKILVFLIYSCFFIQFYTVLTSSVMFL